MGGPFGPFAGPFAPLLGPFGPLGPLGPLGPFKPLPALAFATGTWPQRSIESSSDFKCSKVPSLAQGGGRKLRRAVRPLSDGVDPLLAHHTPPYEWPLCFPVIYIYVYILHMSKQITYIYISTKYETKKRSHNLRVSQVCSCIIFQTFPRTAPTSLAALFSLRSETEDLVTFGCRKL